MNKKLLGLFVVLVMFAGSATPVHAASLTSIQVQAILTLLNAFGADQSTINSVEAALNGGTPATSGQSFCHNFNSDLTVGSTGDDVSALNQALSSAGVDTTGNTALFTENNAGDVVSFQAKYGIRQTGYVGPLTRAKLNSLYGCSSNQQSTTPTTQSAATTQPMSPAPTASISANPTVVNPGQPSTLTFSSANAAVCSGANVTSGQTSGSIVVYPTQTTTYTMNCFERASMSDSGRWATGSVTVTVTPTAQSLGTLIPSDTFVSFNVAQGTSNPSPYNLHLTNSSSAPVNFTLNVPNQPNWLNCGYSTETMMLSPGGVMGVCVAVDATKTSGPGTYTANLVVSGDFANSPITIPVTLTVMAATQTSTNQPNITSTSAKAAESFEMDAGGTASISGTYLAGNDLSTTKVFIGGIQTTVTYASDNLLYITVPSSLTAGQSYSMYVSNEKGTSNVVSVKILSNVSLGTQTSVVPTISYINPTSATPGSVVMVYGTNFDQNSLVAFDSSSPQNQNISPSSGYPVNVATAPGVTALAFTVPANVTVGTHTIQVLEHVFQSNGTLPMSNSVPLTLTAATPADPVINSFSINASQQFSLSAQNYSTITFQAQCGNFVHVLRSVDGTSVSYPTGNASLCNAKQYYSKSTTNADPSVPPIYNEPFYLWNAQGTVDGQTSFIGNGPGSNVSGSAVMTVEACNTAGKCVQQSTSFPIYAKACLAAGTTVSMSDGSHKNIEDIKIGDLVKSFDGERMTTGVVTEVVQREDPIITINGILKAAPDEVVYLANGKTETADHLKIGDQLIRDGGRAVAVTIITRSLGLAKTYDLALANGNAFFAEGYLVQSLNPSSE